MMLKRLNLLKEDYLNDKLFVLLYRINRGNILMV